MARLPTVGADDNAWGTVLNEYLATAHNADGTLKLDVKTIADLKAINVATLTDKQQALVAGYYTPGDGGGGVFYYDAASSTADNGGTVIAPTAGAGRWLRAYSGPVSVKWFGARCDSNGADGNGTDDTAAFTAAATFAAAAGVWLTVPDGICRFVPAGTYVAPANLKLSGPGALFIDHASNQWRIGNGSTYADLTVRVNTSRTATFHIVGTAAAYADSYSELRNIAVAGNSGGPQLIYMEFARHVTVRNCLIVSTDNTVPYTNRAIATRSAEYCTFVGNRIQNFEYGIYLQGSRYCEVSGNRIRGARVGILQTGHSGYAAPNKWMGYLSLQNRITNNIVEACYEESISGDMPVTASSATGQNDVLPFATIASVTETSSNILTIKFTETGGGTPYAADFANNWYMCVQTGNAAGTMVRIIDSGDDGTNAWVTVANLGERFEAATTSCKVWIGCGVFQSVIANNIVDTQGATNGGVSGQGIVLWGGGWQNIIVGNNVTVNGGAGIICTGLAFATAPKSYAPNARNIISGNVVSRAWVDATTTEAAEGLNGSALIHVGRYGYEAEADIGRATHHNVITDNQINNAGGIRIERSDWDLIDGNCCAGTEVVIELKSASSVQVGHNICVDGLVVAANISDVLSGSTYTLLSH